MLSKPRLCALVSHVLCWFLSISWSSRPAQAQAYFTGPYGPGGTWNVYEYRGFLGSERLPDAGQPRTWLEAHQDAIGRTEPLSGANLPGHLATFSGPTAQQENDFIAELLSSSAWIGLTDNEAFGGGEAGSNGMAGLGNPPGDGIGWKWTSGEVFDFANWGLNSPSTDDFGGMSRTGTWSAVTTSAALSYIVEYETRSPAPINLPPTPQPSLLPGPPVRTGAFAIREVVSNGPIEGPGNGGSIRGAVQSLQNIGPNAIVRDYYAPMIDHQAEQEFPLYSLRGPNRAFEVLQREDVRVDQLDDFVMVAHAQILIPEGQGGDWTFSVSSDDGFELYIPGARFESPGGSTMITHHGSLIFPTDKSASPILGYVSLAPGIHDIELLYYEDEIRSSVELSAAPGRKMNFDANSFTLVGAPAQNVFRRLTPVVTDAFQFTRVHRTPNDPGGTTPDEHITSLARAKELINSPDGNDFVVTHESPTVNYDNIAIGRDGSSQHGRYSGDESLSLGLGVDFASIARNALSIPEAGTYTFGFAVLDGGELTIEGAQFNEVFGEGVITNGGQSLTLDRSLADGVAFASVDLLPGEYPLEFLTYNRDGDMSAELFVTAGRIDSFNTTWFQLLSQTTRPTHGNRPAGLQLVPEPATVWSATIGGLLVAIAAWSRRLSQKKTLAVNR